MEGLLPKVRCQIIADFYRKNLSKGKLYTHKHFSKMGYKKLAKDVKHLEPMEGFFQGLSFEPNFSSLAS